MVQVTPATSDWTGKWVACKLSAHDSVASTRVLSPQRVQVERTKHPTVVIGTIASSPLRADELRPLVETERTVSFAVNVPKEAWIAGDALRLSERVRVPVGGWSDLQAALRLADVRDYVSSEFGFIDRVLRQHDTVAGFERLDDRRYRVSRHGAGDVMVVFLREYELTVDHVRTARERYGRFDILVITNPSGRATGSAEGVATSMGGQVHKWKSFLGALNRP